MKKHIDIPIELCYRPQRSWGKVIFSEACVKNSVHGGSTWAGTPPPPHPLGPGTPPRTRYTPLTRYTPDQVPLPEPGTHPPGTRYTPRDQVPPPPHQPWDQVHPPSSACWEIQATSRRYASYWNAFLFKLNFK